MNAFVILGISLGVGLLIGMQRQRTDNRLGGIRTFPLISLLGTFCGMLGREHNAWVIGAGLITILGLVGIFSFMKAQRHELELGQTTAVAALLTYAIGAYLPQGEPAVGIVAAGVVVVLLHAKGPMHWFVGKMGHEDMTAIMQVVVVALVILPVLPNKNYGPYDVLNPFDIWRMVVLITGISLAGYILYKLLGGRTGTWLGGLLAGLISSTAATVSFSRRAAAAADTSRLAIAAIVIASAVAYFRIIIEIALVVPAQLGALIPPFAAMLVWTTGVAIASFLAVGPSTQEVPPAENPAELKSALIFGVIYAIVLVAVAAGKTHFGAEGLYIVAVISGLTNVDAITLSVSRMVEVGGIETSGGWRLIMVGSLANFAFKGVLAAFLGGYRFALKLWIYFGIAMAGGFAIIGLWPEHWKF